jgi:uncharacterized protein DUF3581
MFTENYYTRCGESFLFSKQQGSDFAKHIAGDFNPLHDLDNSRFCVPGDLLFSVMLSQYGINQQMTFDFQGMVNGDMPIAFSESEDAIEAINDKQKRVLMVERSGEKTQDPVFIEGLIRAYVAFSGKTFPHVIIGLMKDEGMMINTRRPMVIYDQMSLSFNRFSNSAPQVELKSCQFDVNGKRGMVTMNFDLRADGNSIGSGEKKIIMSGLRPYEQPDIDYLVDTYNAARKNY